MTFECVVKKGHTGAGRYGEETIRIYARDIIEAMSIAKKKGGVKKGRAYDSCQGIISVRAAAN